MMGGDDEPRPEIDEGEDTVPLGWALIGASAAMLGQRRLACGNLGTRPDWASRPAPACSATGTAAPKARRTSTIAATCFHSLRRLEARARRPSRSAPSPPAAPSSAPPAPPASARTAARSRRRPARPRPVSGAAGRDLRRPASRRARPAAPSRPVPSPEGPARSPRSSRHGGRRAALRGHGRARARSPPATRLPAAGGNAARPSRGSRRRNSPPRPRRRAGPSSCPSLSSARPSITAPPTAASLSHTGDSASHTACRLASDAKIRKPAPVVATKRRGIGRQPPALVAVGDPQQHRRSAKQRKVDHHLEADRQRQAGGDAKHRAAARPLRVGHGRNGQRRGRPAASHDDRSGAERTCRSSNRRKAGRSPAAARPCHAPAASSSAQARTSAAAAAAAARSATAIRSASAPPTSGFISRMMAASGRSTSRDQ